MSEFHIIVFSNLDDTQRNLIMAKVKELTPSWWHQLPDVWIVEGGPNINSWRDELTDFTPVGSGSFMYIFRLPDEGQRKWTGFAAEPDWQWIWKTYATSSGTFVEGQEPPK